MKLLNLIFGILTAIGAINWGLVGFFDFNLVTALFSGMMKGDMMMMNNLEQIVYCVIGVAGLFSLITLCKCSSSSCTAK